MEYITWLLAAYVIFCKVWPYCLYPNYLLKSKIENYPELEETATKLRGVNKLKTVENVYRYMQQTYTGHSDVLKIKSLLSILKLGDFSTKEILNKKQFLWCHTQNRLLKSILVNTGIFREDEIVIQKNLLKSFFIHQWLYFKIDDKKVLVDPYYEVFKIKTN